MNMDLKTKKAFTLAEIAVVFVIIALIAVVGIKITKSGTNLINKYMSYAAFINLKQGMGELIADDATLPAYGVAPTTHDGLCEKLTDVINTIGDVSCSLTATAASNFKTATPNFVTANGIRYFNFGSNADADGIYTIYVDIDGSKRNGVLNEDVLAFNIYLNGCVIPEKTSVAANSINYITAVIQYKDSSGATVRPLQGVSYREALCKAGRGPSTAYCDATSLYPAYTTTITECNTSSGNDCEVMVINGNSGINASCTPPL